MGKVIVGLAVSLDGYIEGPHGEYDWCFTDQDYGMTEFLRNTGAIFYGRKSYEMMLRADASGQNPFGSIASYVFSNTLEKAYPNTELVSGDLAANVKAIVAKTTGNCWFFGGAELLRSFLEAELIDEIGMAIHPILLGSGKPLFLDIERRIQLALKDSKTYSSGLVYSTYTVIK